MTRERIIFRPAGGKDQTRRSPKTIILTYIIEYFSIKGDFQAEGFERMGGAVAETGEVVGREEASFQA